MLIVEFVALIVKYFFLLSKILYQLRVFLLTVETVPLSEVDVFVVVGHQEISSPLSLPVHSLLALKETTS